MIQAFLRFGPPGPTLVFLHEALGSIAQWRDFPQALAEATGFGALVYERRGHGLSDPLPGPRDVRYLHDEALTALPEVLAGVGVDDVVLVGHSDGGSIALIFAGDPEARRGVRVRGVITEAAHVMVEAETLAGILAAKRLYETTDLQRRLARYHGDRTGPLFYGWADAWLMPEFRGLCLDEYVRRIECPILAMQGANDEYGTPAQLEAIERAATARVETVLIPNCGHTPHQQAREVTLERMVAFVKTL